MRNEVRQFSKEYNFFYEKERLLKKYLNNGEYKIKDNDDDDNYHRFYLYHCLNALNNLFHKKHTYSLCKVIENQ